MSVTEDKFSNGYFWELYRDLEKQFSLFLEYVPFLKGNEATYSFKLLNLMLSIGGHIDSAFLEMARYSEFKDSEKCKKMLKKKKDFDEYKKCVEKKGKWKGKKPSPPSLIDYVECFEEQYELSKIKVNFKCIPERVPLTPFKENDNGKPRIEWWDDYNQLKHNVGENLKNANLQNTRDALACAFLLNVIHKPAILRLNDYGLIKPKNDRCNYSREEMEKMLKDSRPNVTIETDLFHYDYTKNPQYKK